MATIETFKKIVENNKQTLSNNDIKKLTKYVTSWDEVEVGIVMCTDNYDMFEIMAFNRGEKDGVDKKKVEKLNKVKRDGNFLKGEERIKVNMFQIVVDGAHRLTSAKENNELAIFEIDTEPSNQTRDPKILLNNIDKGNSLINGTWTSTNSFKSALSEDNPLPLAVLIKSYLISSYNKATTDGRSRVFTHVHLFKIMNKFENSNGNLSILRSQYDNDELYSEMITDEGREYILNVLKIGRNLKKHKVVSRPYDVIKYIASKDIAFVRICARHIESFCEVYGDEFIGDNKQKFEECGDYLINYSINYKERKPKRKNVTVSQKQTKATN